MPKGHNSLSSISNAVAAATCWWAGQREHLPYYKSHQIQNGVGLHMRQLAAALRLLGWTRAKAWTRIDGRRVLRYYWVPPGGQAPRPKRGRPAFWLHEPFRAPLP